jgi:hypothetical protein
VHHVALPTVCRRQGTTLIRRPPQGPLVHNSPGGHRNRSDGESARSHAFGDKTEQPDEPVAFHEGGQRPRVRTAGLGEGTALPDVDGSLSAQGLKDDKRYERRRRGRALLPVPNIGLDCSSIDVQAASGHCDSKQQVVDRIEFRVAGESLAPPSPAAEVATNCFTMGREVIATTGGQRLRYLGVWS